MVDNTKFWLNNPKALFSSMDVLPTSEMTSAERLNALTRLLLIVTAGMYFLGYDQYFTVLALGILLIIILRSNQPREHFQPSGVAPSQTTHTFQPNVTEMQALNTGVRGFDPSYDSRPHVPNPSTDACQFDQGVSLINTAYEVTPSIQFNHDDAAKRSYMNAKYELTPLTEADGFTQIWRNEPGMCGGYSMVPDPLTTFPVDDLEAQGQCNYIVRSVIDHLPISQAQNGLQSVRPMAEAAYNQSILDFRSSIMNEHIDRFRRERQHNCPDMKLGSVSAGAGGSI